MKVTEINELVNRLTFLWNSLDEQYMESEGEVTELAEQTEEEIEVIKTLLEGAPDDLGRYIVSIEDSIERKKNEERTLAARRKRQEAWLDFVKSVARKVVVVKGETVKDTKVMAGEFYKFRATESVKVTADMDAIAEEYLERINDKLDELGLPDWMTVEIDASVKIAKEHEELDERFFHTTVTPTLSFVKPRKQKER